MKLGGSLPTSMNFLDGEKGVFLVGYLHFYKDAQQDGFLCRTSTSSQLLESLVWNTETRNVTGTGQKPTDRSCKFVRFW